MIITLSPFEIRMANSIGKLRNDKNYELGRKHRYNLKSNMAQDEAMHQVGVACELAVAKALNRYWSNPFSDASDLDRDLADVGERIQVRGTKYLSGSLLLHPTDVDNHWFFLVVGNPPELNVVGGILGAEGKDEKFWMEKVPGRPCFFVPQSALQPVEKLINVVY